MKKIHFTILILLLISTCLLQSGFAQDYTTWKLPNQAKMRLGKGMISGNITFSPDSSLLAVASTIGIWIYDGSTGKELKLLTNNTGYTASIAFSPDGKKLVSSNYTDILLWDVPSGNLIYSIQAEHEENITCVAYHPNGKTIATGGEWNDGIIKFWDAATGTLMTTLATDTVEAVSTIAFSPDGTLLASGSEYDNIITIWDVATGKLIKNIYGHKDDVRNITFNRDGTTLASISGWYFFGNPNVYLWDIATGKLITTLSAHSTAVQSVAFSPDGKTLASAGNDTTVCIWDAINGTYQTALLAHRNIVRNVAFSPDGHTLATGSLDGTVILWDAERLQQKTIITEHIAWGDGIDFSPDGQQIVTGTWDATIRQWNTSTGKNIHTLRGHRSKIYAVAFSPDGQTIASSGGWHHDFGWSYPEDTIRLWNADYGTHKDTFLGHTSSVYSLTFSSDGSLLVSCSSDEKIILWDTATGNPLFTINTNKTNQRGNYINATFSPDGQKLASRDKSKIQLWDIASRQLITTFSTNLLTNTNIVFSPDGKTLATGGKGNVILLWNIDARMEKIFHTGHTGTYMRVAYSPDGSTLATVGLGYQGDGTLRFWEPENGMLKRILKDTPNGIEDFTFSPDGKTLALLGSGGAIYLWNTTLSNPPLHEADVNRDGFVDIHDLVIVAANFGKAGPNAADVNDDGIVNIADLIKVAGAIEDAAAAPLATSGKQQPLPTKTEIQKWLAQAQQLNITDITSQKGIRFLEQLLTLLTPQKTTLLPNYPNPFNPETWIPYQLSEPADVSIQIYSADGQLIRSFDIL